MSYLYSINKSHTHPKFRIMLTFESLENRLVPYSGPANTIEGEMIRAVQRIEYRYYNDGDEYDQGYGLETVSPSVDWLIHRSPIGNSINDQFDAGGDYENIIKAIKKLVLEFVVSKGGKYIENISEDSREFKLAGKCYVDTFDDFDDDLYDFDED